MLLFIEELALELVLALPPLDSGVLISFLYAALSEPQHSDEEKKQSRTAKKGLDLVYVNTMHLEIYKFILLNMV